MYRIPHGFHLQRRRDSLDELALPLLAPIPATPHPKRKSRQNLAEWHVLQAQQQQQQQQLQRLQAHDNGMHPDSKASVLSQTGTQNPGALQPLSSQDPSPLPQSLSPLMANVPRQNLVQDEQQHQEQGQPKLTAFTGLHHLIDDQGEQRQHASPSTLMQVLNTCLPAGGISSSPMHHSGEMHGSTIPPLSLSAGQQQLLCLSRMLLAHQERPRAVVLLDEITSNVDRATAATIHQVRAV